MMLLAQFVVILLRLSFTALPCRSLVKSEELFAQFCVEFSKIENKYIFHFQGNNRSQREKKKLTKKAKPTQSVAGKW